MIHQTLSNLIVRNNLRQKQLAARFGVSESHLSLIVRGPRRPSSDVARKIEAETGIPFKELLPSPESRNGKGQLPRSLSWETVQSLLASIDWKLHRDRRSDQLLEIGIVWNPATVPAGNQFIASLLFSQERTPVYPR